MKKVIKSTLPLFLIFAYAAATAGENPVVQQPVVTSSGDTLINMSSASAEELGVTPLPTLEQRIVSMERTLADVDSQLDNCKTQLDKYKADGNTRYAAQYEELYDELVRARNYIQLEIMELRSQL